jgi:hypothetical protein
MLPRVIPTGVQPGEGDKGICALQRHPLEGVYQSGADERADAGDRAQAREVLFALGTGFDQRLDSEVVNGRFEANLGPPTGYACAGDLLLPSVQVVPECPWRQNAHLAHDSQSLDRRITGHEDVGSPGNRFSNNARVIVVHRRNDWFSGFNQCIRVLPHELDDFVGACRGKLDLLTHRSPQLDEHPGPRNQFVFEQDQLKQVCTQTPGSEGAYKDVCVEKNPQERALKISSSVRSPCASAKGSVRRRNSRNRATATWRLSASRAKSLLLRPVDLASRSSALSSFSSRRIVNVVMRMNLVRQCRTTIAQRRSSTCCWRFRDQVRVAIRVANTCNILIYNIVQRPAKPSTPVRVRPPPPRSQCRRAPLGRAS